MCVKPAALLFFNYFRAVGVNVWLLLVAFYNRITNFKILTEMNKKNEDIRITKAINYEPLLCAVTPIKDNSSYSYWINRPEFDDGNWHHINIVVENGIRTNYIDGVKI